MNVINNTVNNQKQQKHVFADAVPLKARRCPDCGAEMTETDIARKRGSIFIWYKCERIGCSGQWLRKYQELTEVAI